MKFFHNARLPQPCLEMLPKSLLCFCCWVWLLDIQHRGICFCVLHAWIQTWQVIVWWLRGMWHHAVRSKGGKMSSAETSTRTESKTVIVPDATPPASCRMEGEAGIPVMIPPWCQSLAWTYCLQKPCHRPLVPRIIPATQSLFIVCHLPGISSTFVDVTILQTQSDPSEEPSPGGPRPPLSPKLPGRYLLPSQSLTSLTPPPPVLIAFARW